MGARLVFFLFDLLSVAKSRIYPEISIFFEAVGMFWDFNLKLKSRDFSGFLREIFRR